MCHSESQFDAYGAPCIQNNHAILDHNEKKEKKQKISGTGSASGEWYFGT